MAKRPFFIKLLTLLLCIGLPIAAHATPKADEDLVYQANFGTGSEVAGVLARGANPNAKSAEGWPAISLAATRNDAESIVVADTLIKAGADVNVRDPNGETPLMNAIVANHLAMVRFLISNKGDFRAISTSGRTVLEFAEYYGNPEVVSVVTEAIAHDDREISEGRSQRRFHRILSDFIYNHCVLQYVGYNLGTSLYRTPEEQERAKNLQAMAISKIGNAQVELEHNFKMNRSYTKSIGDNTQKMVYQEMEDLITNRNRRNKGVGTETDLDNRCKRVVMLWKQNYAGYETDASRQEPGAASPASAK